MKASLEVEALDTRSLIVDCYRPHNASDRIADIVLFVMCVRMQINFV